MIENALTCKNCGAPLDPSTAQGGVVRCSYCRSSFTLPKTDGAAREFLYQGEHDLDTCEFDKAYSAYRKAAELDPQEPEAYFGMALASFKVQYIKDRVNNCLQPICHEISDKQFKSDLNYRKAISLATPEQRVQYDRKAKDIDYIASEFSALKDSGVKYDCFLCTKVTGEDGKNTQESYDTLKIYNYLKSKGYSPFYSEQEINERTGIDYESLILYALRSAKCMLIICRNEEYLRTPWVENEYRRFLALINNEHKESDAITFVFGGKPIEKLPGRNGKIQGINLDRPDAYSRILDYVEKHSDRGKLKREEEERLRREEERRRLEAEEKHRREEEERLRYEAEQRRREDEERKKREDEQSALLDAYRKQLEEMKSMLSSRDFAPTPAARTADETYDLVLKDSGTRIIDAIKTVREITSMGLADAKYAVDNTPSVLKGNVSPDEGVRFVKMFKDIGATAAIEVHREPDKSRPYTLVLENTGARKVDVIIVARTIKDMGLIEAKRTVENTPVVLRDDLSYDEAQKFAKDLRNAGATVKVM